MTTTTDLLVEIGTEELPPKSLLRLSDAFRDSVAAGLTDSALGFEDIAAFATPRRLALLVSGLERRQPDREVEMRGPPQRVAFDSDGNPTRAAQAFADKCGVAVADLGRVETDKGVWLMHQSTETGREAQELIPALVAAGLSKLPIPRPMRWGASEVEFVRPVHWVVMLLGEQVLNTRVLGFEPGDCTYGHRFHAPQAIRLRRPADYAAQLERDAYVIADFADRRERIRVAVRNAAASLGGEPVGDDALLDEVTALVEWPVPVSASFDRRFLELPEEVLIETLQSHQRYFPVRGSDRKLLPKFITVANIDSKDPDTVRAGNERVVIPRLADAAFFYDADRRRRLADRIDALNGVVFQRKLGTLYARMERVEALALWLADQLGKDALMAQRAARLAKCDLLTDMVGEFPSLQGTMGRYYALHDGESEEVASAIEEQYLPRYAGDRLPQSDTGKVLAVADKIDTIAGIFAIGQRPTGTRDPFALRRSALGVLRILIEQQLDVDLPELLANAVTLQPVETKNKELVEELYTYFLERLRSWYLDGDFENMTAHMFDAVAARQPASPLDFHARMLAVRDFNALDAAEALSAANKRIANILRSADEEIAPTLQPDALSEPAERELHQELERVRAEAAPLLEQRRYSEALTLMAQLRPAVDRFFDDVMVMSEDDTLRRNRLALLGALRDLFLRAADLSRLQPG